jgi:hypothetical protein
MGFQAEVLHVLIASPSDVKNERDEIERSIYEWNRRFSENTHVVLLPRRWEKDVVPAYRGKDPQKIINEQIVNKCDILIGVFWTKLGTPTLEYSSGTLEEIEVFIKNGKEIMLYFVQNPVPFNNIDPDEIMKVRQFKEEYSSKGIYAPYDPNSIIDHLYEKVIHYKEKSPEHPEHQTLMFERNNKSADPVNIEQLILTFTLTPNEIMILAYILETGNRHLGAAWKSKTTLESIQSWKTRREIYIDLDTDYSFIIANLNDRALIVPVEYTGPGNVRLYSMPIHLFDQLRSLSEQATAWINEIIDRYRIEGMPF